MKLVRFRCIDCGAVREQKLDPRRTPERCQACNYRRKGREWNWRADEKRKSAKPSGSDRSK